MPIGATEFCLFGRIQEMQFALQVSSSKPIDELTDATDWLLNARIYSSMHRIRKNFAVDCIKVVVKLCRVLSAHFSHFLDYFICPHT